MANKTVLIYSAALLLLLHQNATATKAILQHTQKLLTIPIGQHTSTTKTLQLNLTSLLQKAVIAFHVPNIYNNLLAVVELCNAGCDVMFDRNGIVVEHNGVIVL